MNRLIVFIIISGVVLFGQGCNDIPDCTLDVEPNTVIVEYFNKADSVLTPINFSSIRALDTDSIFYQDTTLSTYDLELNPSSDRSTFIFLFDNVSDTMELNYERSTIVISEQCGPTVGFSDISVVNHTFDSVAVVNNFLNRQLTENIEIYN